MSEFPQEIVDLICDQLAANRELKLARFATISKKWQVAVERKTFKRITVCFPDAVEFSGLFSGRGMLWDRMKVFTFSTEEEKSDIEFFCEEFGPPGALEDVVDEKQRTVEYQAKILKALYLVMETIGDWEIESFQIVGQHLMLDENSLAGCPRLHNIERFFSNVEFSNPTAMCKLAERIPQLREFWLSVPRMTKQQRSELAKEIPILSEKLPGLTALKLRGEPDEWKRQPPGVGPEDLRENGIDMLCRELRLLTQKKGFLALMLEWIPVCAELFGDVSVEPGLANEVLTNESKAQGLWPTMKDFIIQAHEMSSTGTWYYGDYGACHMVITTRGQSLLEGTPHMHRMKIDQEASRPLVKSFKEVTNLTCMPSLKVASFGIGAYTTLRREYGGN